MYGKILVPLDGSQEAESAIMKAEGLAKSFGSTLHFIHVIEHIKSGVLTADATRYPSELNLEVERLYEEGQISEEGDYLETLANPLRKEGINVETAVDSGNVVDYIAAYARRSDIDLIVLTKHGHGGIRHLFLGSVADRLIRSVDVDVLVVHV